MQYSIIQYYRCNIVDDPGNPDPDPEFYNAKKTYMIFVFLVTNTNVYP